MLRFVYFFSDSPNLMKTTQNFLYSSWSGSDIHYMWNDSKYLLFRHIADLYFSDQEFRLHTLPMLTMDHIVLMCYSKMKVKLARKVMRKFVEISRQTSGNVEVLVLQLAAKWRMMFLTEQTRGHKTKHIMKKNLFVKPYSLSDDERLSWLLNVFVKYLEDWKQNTLTRPGIFSREARGKIFLSQQTHEGLLILAYSYVEVIHFLLGKRFKYVLS